MSAAGIHTLVAPTGLSTSTRVVTSNVRQSSRAGCFANDNSAFERATLARVKPEYRKKSRRFMHHRKCIEIAARSPYIWGYVYRSDRSPFCLLRSDSSSESAPYFRFGEPIPSCVYIVDTDNRETIRSPVFQDRC